MDVKLTFLVIVNLLTPTTGSKDVFWNLLRTTVDVDDTSGIVNGSTNQTSNNLQWHFTTAIGQGEMIRLIFTIQGNYDELTLDLKRTEKIVKVGISCYYFTRSEQIDARCEATATQSGCEFVNLTTTHLNLFYKSDVTPQFVFNYEYLDCLGNPFHSTTIPQTTTTSPPFVTIPIVTTTTRSSSITTNQTEVSVSGLTTSDTNSSAEFNGRNANLPTEEAENSVETTQPTSTHNTGVTNGLDTTVIIIVAVAVILFVLIVVLLLVCGKRFRRYQKQLKELHSGKFSSVSNSGAPPIDPLYEEIAPRLPLRNVNMQEPGYEVPLCSMGSTEEGKSQSQSSLTVENELYLKPQKDEMPPTSQDATTKYGSVENELYHENDSDDDVINADVVTKDLKCVALTNELYVASSDHSQENVNVVNERPQTPQLPTTVDPELDAHVGDTVSNVLYNL